MKNSHPSIGLARFCRLLGITRQAFYQHFWHAEDLGTEQQLLLDQIRQIRADHPVIGCRKLYCMLQPFLLEHQIKIGRDALFDLLSAHKLLVRKRNRKVTTTWSHHWFKKYPNLIKDWDARMPGQLWVADITYVRVNNGFLYLSLITDAYSHKIMGYHIAETLEAVHTTKALEMALAHQPLAAQLIHHSDRGLQYCSSEYVNLLKQNNIQISMTENGDPLENPIAERINGIIKNEYLKYYTITNQTNAMQLLERTVNKYNRQRPHQSINMLTPEIVHELKLSVNRKWGKNRQLPYIVNP
jgi:transposase InsO family protein